MSWDEDNKPIPKIEVALSYVEAMSRCVGFTESELRVHEKALKVIERRLDDEDD